MIIAILFANKRRLTSASDKKMLYSNICNNNCLESSVPTVHSAFNSITSLKKHKFKFVNFDFETESMHLFVYVVQKIHQKYDVNNKKCFEIF